MNAPILVSVYNRKDHLHKCIESLKKNRLSKSSIIYIVSDGPKESIDKHEINEVREYIDSIEGFVEVIKILREKNYGSYNSILSAMSELMQYHDSFIFLEDDIEVSPTFLDYLNDGLTKFKNNQSILAICSYSIPIVIPKHYGLDVYLGERFSPWGFAIWKDRFLEIDFSKKNRYDYAINSRTITKKINRIGQDYFELLKMDSASIINAIDVKICFYQIINSLYCVFPKISLSRNLGFDGSGEHCGVDDRISVDLDLRIPYSLHLADNVKPSKVILKRFKDFQNHKKGCIINTIDFFQHVFFRLRRKTKALLNIGK